MHPPLDSGAQLHATCVTKMPRCGGGSRGPFWSGADPLYGGSDHVVPGSGTIAMLMQNRRGLCSKGRCDACLSFSDRFNRRRWAYCPRPDFVEVRLCAVSAYLGIKQIVDTPPAARNHLGSRPQHLAKLATIPSMDPPARYHHRVSYHVRLSHAAHPFFSQAPLAWHHRHPQTHRGTSTVDAPSVALVLRIHEMGTHGNNGVPVAGMADVAAVGQKPSFWPHIWFDRLAKQCTTLWP